jgi:ABC-type sugar transport system ATPase subunit
MSERIAKPEHIAVAPGEPPIVDVQGLWTQFGKGNETFTVHQDLNFTVQRGEMLSLVGGSGTGKTVLLRQILGLARPTRGQVTVLGRPASEMGREGAASRVGMLFQQGALFSAFNVLDNVAFALREQGTLPPELVRDAALVKLQMVGLKPEHATRMPANVHDKHPLPDLLHGNERRVYGDSAYASQKTLIASKAPRAKDFTNQRTRRAGEVDEVQRAKNRNKSRVRARVEHVFAVVKRLWGFTKVRYRGLQKNATRAFTALALANIYLARGRLQGQVRP